MIGTLDVSSDDDHKSPATPTALTETMNKNKNSLNHESRQRKEKDKLHASAMFKRSINKARLDSLTALDFYCW